VAQRLDEGPLAVDPFVAAGFGQPLSTSDRFRPEPFDRVPHGAVVVRGLHPSQLRALGVTPIQLGLHERTDINVVDDKVVDDARYVDIDEPRVDDLDPVQVAISELCIREIGSRERPTT
jgi:hypothetical protein